MYKLSNQKLLTAWDNSRQQPPFLRALSLLAACDPSRTPDEWLDLNLGQRNFYLLRLHENTFSPQMNCLTTCAACKEKLEFNLNTQVLCADFREQVYNIQHECLLGDYQIAYRLLNTRDIMHSSRQTTLEQAHAVLLERSIIQIKQAGELIEIKQLPAERLQEFINQLEATDPYVEISLTLNCPHCEHTWQAFLDIAEFLWVEVEASVKRLLNEVHVLAFYYGWHEADILALTDQRRQFYLNKLEA